MMRRRLKLIQGKVVTPLVVTLLLLVVSALVIWSIQTPDAPDSNSQEQLVVYCAAGIRAAVEPILQEYEKEFGLANSLHFGPSGALETQVELSQKGDLFLPAAIDPYLRRMRSEQRIAEVIPIAQLRLVVAFSPEQSRRIDEIAALTSSDWRYGFCNEQAAAGQRTKATLNASASGRGVLESATATFPTVTELAGAVRDGGRLDAGIIWDTTARQYGLPFVELPELATSLSTIGVGVLETSTRPQAALRLARYIAAKDRGQLLFEENHYSTITGDRWAENPELTLFSGTINRNAIKDSLQEFEARENCKITTVFDGCGTLVGMMKAGSDPDAYFACDVSYVEQVSNRFDTPLEISDNELVMLVRKGNPHQIHQLSDFNRTPLKVGLCDPDLSALGTLTQRLLKEQGVYAKVIESGAITMTTGDLLVAQMLAGDKLDVAIVYEANCIKALDQLDIVRVDHPLAKAIQPFSIHRNTDFPQLTERLRAYLSSARSAARFKKWGFGWRVEVNSKVDLRNVDRTLGSLRGE